MVNFVKIRGFKVPKPRILTRLKDMVVIIFYFVWFCIFFYYYRMNDLFRNLKAEYNKEKFCDLTVLSMNELLNIETEIMVKVATCKYIFQIANYNIQRWKFIEISMFQIASSIYM